MRHIVRWHIFGMQIVGLIRRDSVAIRHTAGWRRYRLSGLHHAIIKQRRQSAAAFGSVAMAPLNIRSSAYSDKRRRARVTAV